MHAPSHGPDEKQNLPPPLEAKRQGHTLPATLASWHMSWLITCTQHNADLKRRTTEKLQPQRMHSGEVAVVVAMSTCEGSSTQDDYRRDGS